MKKLIIIGTLMALVASGIIWIIKDIIPYERMGVLLYWILGIVVIGGLSMGLGGLIGWLCHKIL